MRIGRWHQLRKGLRLTMALAGALLCAPLLAQGTWTWQQQCSSNEWSAICYTYAGCGYDQNHNPVHRYFNNWGHSQCSVSPGLPGPGSIVIFPEGANARLASNVDIKSVLVSSGAVFDWYSGGLTLRDPANNNSPGTLTNQGLLRVVANSDDFRSLSGLLVNSGTLVHYKHRVWFDGATLQNTGTLELQAGELNHNTGTNLIQNTGAIRKVSPDPNNPTSFTISVPTTNSGRIEVLSGTLSITNLTQTDGETRIHRGTTLTSSNPVQLQGGKLTGAGTLNAALNNTAGTIAPGINDPDHPDLNPLGILTILGNLTLGADAVLEVELVGADNSDPANPQYDQLLIVGQGGYTRTLQLGGILRVKGRDGYVPNPGDAFDIIVRAGSWNRSGSLARVEVDPDTLPCVVFEVQYLPDRVRLVASIPSVDTNRDGCVDDADLLAVLFAFGQTGNGLPEDVVCDGVVDDADLLAVLFAFGQGC